MSKYWSVFEKIIGILQIILGLLFALIAIYSVNRLVNHYGKDLSVYKVFKNSHLGFVLSLLFSISGILLLRNNIKGWVISVAMWFVLSINCLLIVLQWLEKINSFWLDWTYIYLIAFMFFSVSISILIMTSEFRKKYNPNWKNWSAIVMIVIILTIDRFFL